jgi:hypothetical protein
MEQHTTIPGARFVDPKVLARIKDLELLARSVVNGFINGLHRAPFFGASIDFAEHRGYVAGDDIRRVDWKLYARTDRYYVKQYDNGANAPALGICARHPAKLDPGTNSHGPATATCAYDADRSTNFLQCGVAHGLPG